MAGIPIVAPDDPYRYHVNLANSRTTPEVCDLCEISKIGSLMMRGYLLNTGSLGFSLTFYSYLHSNILGQSTTYSIEVEVLV